eukprot:gnl/TRDRNA2_/TRDRNA2_31298_c0_seq1.p1 gnl/TRDRNA2_/TRDRNA2_31298_c0~~gnl/TRDRNA2_/TRDRNA2_31298_c0_seq1.p1  ORF type:complete len:150 (-),score=23.40 gnl/TRDRNA2_/TRDRNA2_31298_c0_seq1:33-482(-)
MLAASPSPPELVGHQMDVLQSTPASVPEQSCSSRTPPPRPAAKFREPDLDVDWPEDSDDEDQTASGASAQPFQSLFVKSVVLPCADETLHLKKLPCAAAPVLADENKKVEGDDWQCSASSRTGTLSSRCSTTSENSECRDSDTDEEWEQ